MKVINENDLIGTDRDVKFKEGRSIRMILEKDGMGFSFHKTIIPKGKKGKGIRKLKKVAPAVAKRMGYKRGKRAHG